VNENLSKLAGLKLEDLIEDTKRVRLEKIDVHKSNFLLKDLAIKKGIDYEELIDYII
jgi:hypothetical protein